MKSKVFTYLSNVGDAFSQLANTAFLFSDNPNESISGRAFANRDDKIWGKVREAIDYVFSRFGAYDHCEGAYKNDITKAAKLLQSQRK